MAFIPTPDAAQTIISYGISGEPAISNTLWWTKPGFTFADLEDLANTLAVWWVATVLGQLSSNILFRQVEAIDQRTLGAPSAIDSTGAGTPGGQSSQLGNLRSSLVVTLRTDSRGRFARGRNYVRGFDEASMGAQLISSGPAAVIETSYNNQVLISPPAGWQCVIRSIQEAGVPQNPANTRPVTSILVRNLTLGTIRRTYNRE